MLTQEHCLYISIIIIIIVGGITEQNTKKATGNSHQTTGEPSTIFFLLSFRVVHSHIFLLFFRALFSIQDIHFVYTKTAI